MTAETALPVGIEDFETIRRENLYYIDKTGLIKGILKIVPMSIYLPGREGLGRL